MFEVGDVVEAIDDCEGTSVAPGFRNGQRFVVNGLSTCRSCKTLFLDIGFSVLKTCTSYCECGHIDDYGKPTYEIVYFRKIEPEYKVVEVSEEINKQVKELILS